MTGTQRTVIFIKKQTNPGQVMFVRGGIDSSVRPGCTEDITSAIDFQVKCPYDFIWFSLENCWLFHLLDEISGFKFSLRQVQQLRLRRYKTWLVRRANRTGFLSGSNSLGYQTLNKYYFRKKTSNFIGFTEFFFFYFLLIIKVGRSLLDGRCWYWLLPKWKWLVWSE